MTINYTLKDFETISLDSPCCKSSKIVAYFFCSSSNDGDIYYLLFAGGVFCRWKDENIP